MKWTTLMDYQNRPIRLTDAPSYMRKTENDAVMEQVDQSGNLLGFSILAVSKLAKSKPLIAELSSRTGDVEC
jgi:hypothetical protein